MHAYLRRGLEVALVVGGGILFFAGQASADETTGAESVLGGNQAATSVVAPVTPTGNSISVVGDSTSSGSATTAPSAPADSGSDTTTGQDSTGGGNQLTAPAAAPVSASGNAVSVLGDSSTTGSTGAGPVTPVGSGPGAPGNPGTSIGGELPPGGATGTGDSGGASSADAPAASALPSLFSAAQAEASLAMTGSDSWPLLLLALLLLLVGAASRITSRRLVAVT